MQRTILVTILLLMAPVGLGGPGDPATADRRLIVHGVSELPMPLAHALDITGGQHLFTIEAADMAVVLAPQAELAGLLDGHVVPDRRYQAPQPIPDEETQGATGEHGWPDDPRAERQWALGFLEMDTAWELETGDRGVTVAIVDGGVDATHEDLEGVPIASGHDYIDGDEDSLHDPKGHGTFIAGLIAAERGNGIGITGMADVSLLSIRAFDENGRYWCSDALAAVLEAADRGADIVNFSGGGGLCFNDNGMIRMFEVVAADVLFVTITHNYWPDVVRCSQMDPGNHPATIAVTAITASGDPAPFSCRAPSAEIAAPGAAVHATRPGDSYSDGSGTSYAAPHVAATAALMLSANPLLTAEQLRSLLIESADDAGPTGWDPAYGHGILDPDEAIELALQTTV